MRSGWDELLWPVVLFDAPTITEFADYLRSTYPESIASKHLGTELPACDVADRVIDEKMVDKFEALIQPLASFPCPGKKEPTGNFCAYPAAAPGSTLLRVMLAGHPRLFAPPEIELLTFNTMRERADVLERS